MILVVNMLKDFLVLDFEAPFKVFKLLKLSSALNQEEIVFIAFVELLILKFNTFAYALRLVKTIHIKLS